MMALADKIKGMGKAKHNDKSPGARSGSKDSLSSGSDSSGRIGRRKSKHDRQIPPEPVQQNPHGEYPHQEAEPPMTAHNLARANRRVQKLEWDERLAEEAEGYAKRLAKYGKLEHSGIEVQGENLFVGPEGADYVTAVQAWLGEEKKYGGEKVGESDNFEEWAQFCKSPVTESHSR